MVGGGSMGVWALFWLWWRVTGRNVNNDCALTQSQGQCFLLCFTPFYLICIILLLSGVFYLFIFYCFVVYCCAWTLS